MLPCEPGKVRSRQTHGTVPGLPARYFANATASRLCTSRRGYYADVAQSPVALCAESGHTPRHVTRCDVCSAFPGFTQPQRVPSLRVLSRRIEGSRGLGGCAECAAGTYAGSNASSCIACPVRSESPPGAGSEAACSCEENYWSVQGVCEPCSVHAYCAPGCEAPATSPGFWRVPWRGEGNARRVCSACRPVRAWARRGRIRTSRRVVRRSTAGLCAQPVPGVLPGHRRLRVRGVLRQRDDECRVRASPRGGGAGGDRCGGEADSERRTGGPPPWTSWLRRSR